MKELAMLNFNASNDNARGFNSPIKEISRIYEALNAMRVAMKSFSKYVPPEVVRLLLYGGEEAKRGGERRILTVRAVLYEARGSWGAVHAPTRPRPP
jgi:hypothetical protein